MRTRILLGLCLTTIIFSAVRPAVGQLLITEFMAANSSTIKDEDNTYPDWIEIYNRTGTNVDVGGWYLTDNAGNLTKWQFPATTLATMPSWWSSRMARTGGCRARRCTRASA